MSGGRGSLSNAAIPELLRRLSWRDVVTERRGYSIIAAEYSW